MIVVDIRASRPGQPSSAPFLLIFKVRRSLNSYNNIISPTTMYPKKDFLGR